MKLPKQFSKPFKPVLLKSVNELDENLFERGLDVSKKQKVAVSGGIGNLVVAKVDVPADDGNVYRLTIHNSAPKVAIAALKAIIKKHNGVLPAAVIHETRKSNETRKRYVLKFKLKGEDKYLNTRIYARRRQQPSAKVESLDDLDL